MKNLIYSLVLALLVSGLAVYSMSSPAAPTDTVLAQVDGTPAVTDSVATTADALSVMTAGSAVGAPQFGNLFDRPALARGMIWTFNHSVYIP